MIVIPNDLQYAGKGTLKKVWTVRNIRFGSIAIILGLLGSAAIPASAHHSFAMFDRDKTVTLNGTVKEFEWINPHTWIRILVAGADGKEALWAIESASTGQQARIGWKSDSLKPGDKVSLQMHPLKNGARGGQLVNVTLPDGKTLGRGGMPNSDFGTID